MEKSIDIPDWIGDVQSLERWLSGYENGQFGPDKAILNRISPGIAGTENVGFPRDNLNELSAILKPKGKCKLTVAFEYITNSMDELSAVRKQSSEDRKDVFRVSRYTHTLDLPQDQKVTLLKPENGNVELNLACELNDNKLTFVLKNNKTIPKKDKYRKILDWMYSVYSLKVNFVCMDGFEILPCGLNRVSYRATQATFCKCYNTSYITKAANGNVTEIELTSMPHFTENRYLPWELKNEEKNLLRFEVLSGSDGEEKVIQNLNKLLGKVQAHAQDILVKYEGLVDDKDTDHQTEFSSDKKAIGFETELARAGVNALTSDKDALWAFMFLNRAMKSKNAASPKFDNWRPFQVVFILGSIAEFTSDQRKKRATLLNFPTGMGKTEAFMGFSLWLAAYLRKKGTNFGTVSIIKYPRVMLSKQQARRAIDLISHANKCLLETDLKKHPFSVGVLYSKDDTPNSIITEQDGKTFSREFEKLKRKLERRKLLGPNHTAEKGNELGFELEKCPLCGELLEPIASEADARILFLCKNTKCEYSSDKWQTGCSFDHRPGELPLYISDEEVFRYLPTIILTTAYKMSAFVLSGRWKTLTGDQKKIKSDRKFGFYFYERDREKAQKVAKTYGHAWFSEKPVQNLPLKPPALVVVDETHLLSGAQASLLGPVETAFLDILKKDGKYPFIVCSSATVNKTMMGSERTYQNHIAQLFGTDLENVRLFPSNLEIYRSEKTPPQRTIVAFYPAIYQKIYAQEKVSSYIFDRMGSKQKNPYYKNPLFYFKSRAEMSNIRRTQEDRVAGVLGIEDIRSHFLVFSSDMEPSEVYENLKIVDNSERTEEWYICLATNMIANGIDSNLFNVMIFHGLPPGVAEYIQARSRIARSETNAGLAVMILDRNDQREIAFMESFAEWHTNYEYFYEENPINKYSDGVVDQTIPRLFHLYAFGNADDSKRPIYLTDQMRAFVEKVLNDEPSACSEAILNWLVEPADHSRMRSEINRKIKRYLGEYLRHLKDRGGQRRYTIYSFDEDGADVNPYLPSISILQVSEMATIKLSQASVNSLNEIVNSRRR